jgi:glycosyltransferase involved in cell wall biosynthesis
MNYQDSVMVATVLMAVYNDENFVAQSVESILSQLTAQIELLIIDDCSSDNSAEILQNFAQKDSRIRIIRNVANLGVGYCRYLGVKEAKGKYIIIMDSDDICIEGRLKKQITFLEENPNIDIVGGAVIEIDNTNKQGTIRQMPLHHEEIVKAIWACPVMHPTVAFRKNRILLAGNYDPNLRRRIDYDLWFRCLNAGLKFANLSEPLTYYRFTPNTHRKQNLKRAFEQAQIGWQGCQLLNLPWWQYLAVMVPLMRAIFPPSLSHLIYRSLAPFDPRKKQV